ncbi:MAG: hypothetical protein AAGK97_00785 [Bacteroidota bacterium]
MRISIFFFLFLLIFASACEDECSEVNSDEKCIKNTIDQALDYFVIDSVGEESEVITLNPDDRICQSLDFGDYAWVAQNEQFRFEGDFTIDPCERNPEIIISVDFLRMDFRDSLLGEFEFYCQLQEHPDSMIVRDTTSGNIGIEDISNNVRVNGFSSDLVVVVKDQDGNLSFTSAELNPEIRGLYNVNTGEIMFERTLLNNLGVEEKIRCTGIKL